MNHTISFITMIILLCNSQKALSQTKGIIETAIDAGDFVNLLVALNKADLIATLQGNGPFTVFAPNDPAFLALPDGVMNELLKPEHTATLSTILQYHVTPANMTAASILAMDLPARITMLAGGETTIRKVDPALLIDTATIIKLDIFATNGIIHVIDSVIFPPLDIVETALIKGTFQTLITALKAADLIATLKGAGPFTVFAPNDAAFAKLPAGTIDDLLKPENKAKLTKILTYHVVSGSLTSAEVRGLSLPRQIKTVSGSYAVASLDGNSIKINDATVLTADVMSTNGIIHIVDTVIMPSADIPDTAIASGNFKTLVQALTAADLVTTLKGDGPLTVFAPNDDAFAKLPAGVVTALVQTDNKPTLSRILQYHVASGSITADDINRKTLPANQTMLAGGYTTFSKNGADLSINDGRVIEPNVFTGNGIIHVIDSVIFPPLDIVETALMNGNFKTLITALKAADLMSTLKGAGPFTVFAPNDDAFMKLPNSTLEDLFLPENKAVLIALLKYHVVHGKYRSDNLTTGENLQTLSGEMVSFIVVGSSVLINDATVIEADVLTANGYIHFIDRVLGTKGTSSGTRLLQSFFALSLIFLCSSVFSAS